LFYNSQQELTIAIVF